MIRINQLLVTTWDIQFNFGADSFVLFGKTIYTLSKNVIATQPLTIRCSLERFRDFLLFYVVRSSKRTTKARSDTNQVKRIPTNQLLLIFECSLCSLEGQQRVGFPSIQLNFYRLFVMWISKLFK